MAKIIDIDYLIEQDSLEESKSMPEGKPYKPTRRQTADCLKEAAANMFFRSNYSMAYEVGLKAWGSRRADVIGNKINGNLVIVEIKSSVADFRTDSKWHEYLPFCDRFYLAFTKEVAKKINTNKELMARIPKRVGVLVLEPTGYMRIVKNAKIVPVEPEVRLSILARLAWRSGELSKRTTRARTRVYLPGEPKLMPKKKAPKFRRTKSKRRYRTRRI